MKVDAQSLKKLLSDAIPMLCKNSLPLQSAFRIEAMIGITLINSNDSELCTTTENEVLLVCFKQTVSDTGDCIQQSFGDAESSDNTQKCSVARTVTATITSASAGSDINIKLEPNSQDHYANETIDIDDEDEEGAYEDDGAYDAQQEYEADEDERYLDDYSQSTKPVKRESTNYEHDGYDNMYDVKSDYYESQSSSWSSQSLPQQRTPKRRVTSTGGVGKVRTPRNKLLAGAVGRNVVAANKANKSLPALQASQMAAGVEEHDMLKGLCRTIASQSVVSQKLYICHFCNAQLGNKNTLVNHIKGSHLGASLYSCEHCGESFKWAMQLHRHRNRYHGEALNDFSNELNI